MTMRMKLQPSQQQVGNIGGFCFVANFFLFGIEDGYIFIRNIEPKCNYLIKQVHTLPAISAYYLLDENEYNLCCHFSYMNYLTKTSALFVPNSVIQHSG